MRAENHLRIDLLKSVAVPLDFGTSRGGPAQQSVECFDADGRGCDAPGQSRCVLRRLSAPGPVDRQSADVSHRLRVAPMHVRVT
jgi:hypothetical protein